MSTRIRFTAAKQVFEAFPSLADDIKTPPGDEAPLDFARKLLATARRFEAVAYAAYLLPRREAVWWGCQCVRATRAGKDDAALASAEAWVRDPEDSQRRAALAIAESGDKRGASTWLAMAAGHSGGNIAPDGSRPVAAAPHVTAVAVKVAVILAISQSAPRDQAAWIAACVEACIRFAEGGDARIRPVAGGAAEASRAP